MFNYAIMLPFDYDPDPNTWLDTSQFSLLEVIMAQGGAGADLRVSVSEVERF